MNVGELVEMLSEFGDHIDVRVLIEGERRDAYRPVTAVEYLSQAPELDDPVVVIGIE